MIRITALWLFVGGMAIYSRRDWYVSLCGLILLTAVIEHPDMPKTMFGIQGLNPWNLLLLAVCAGWLSARRAEGLTWDMPRLMNVLLILYLAVVMIGFERMLADRRNLADSTATLVSEYLVNSLKWVVPGLLLFDGCRSRKRFYMAIAAVLGVYLFLGLYVIKWMPLGVISSGSDLEQRALKILENEVGYSRVNMSMMLAAAAWAVFVSRSLLTDARHRVFALLAAGAVVYAQALTGGRMGYVTCGAVGAVLCSIRNRALLATAPIVVVIILAIVPAVGQRMLQGFDPDSASSDGNTDQRFGDPYSFGRNGPDFATVTAGRTLIWPYVIAKIAESPLTGYGQLAMRRTGLVSFLATDLEEGFEHPHNAYLELLLDNGVLGFLAIMPFYVIILTWSLKLYADSRSPIFTATGGICAAFVLALLVAGMGSQTFYPREGAVGMWCSIGLLLRVWVQRRRMLGVASPAAPRLEFPKHIVWPGPGPTRQPARPDPDVPAALPPAPVDDLLWRPA